MTTRKRATLETPEETPLLKGLEDAGLTKNEAKVYLYLLKLGKLSGATKIAIATGIHRQYVHVTLQKLMQIGLVVAMRHGDRNKYKAAPPRAFEQFARKKFEFASKTTQDLSTISALGNEQDVEIIQGEHAMRIYELERIRSTPIGSIQYFIGGASKKFFEIMGESYKEEYAPEATRREVGTRYLGSIEEVNTMFESKQVQAHTEVRILQDMPEGVVNVMILNDTITFYTFVTPPILYVIHSEIVAKSYLKFFNVLWRLGKEN